MKEQINKNKSIKTNNKLNILKNNIHNNKMSYDKMDDYVETIFNVFNSVNGKADLTRDKRLKCVALLILGYVTNLAKEHAVDLKQIQEPESINLIPFFEYISVKEIKLLEFDTIKVEDIDVSKSEDVERFILSHIYYLTQK